MKVRLEKAKCKTEVFPKYLATGNNSVWNSDSDLQQVTAEKTSFSFFSHSITVCSHECVFVCVLRNFETLEYVMSNPRMNLLGNGTLEINDVSHNDTGLYTCSVGDDKLAITAELEVLSE